MRAVTLLFHDVYAAAPAESGFVSPAADRYKLSVEAFEAQLAGIAAVRQDAPLRAGELQAAAAGGPRRVAPLPFLVTVDDGGVSYFTRIAERLEQRGWSGHCFVSTDRIGTRGFLDARQIRELDARGHVIGSHTASHPARFNTHPYAEMVREWATSRRALEDILGHAVTTGSVPGGAFSADVARAAAEAGLTLLFTSEPETVVGAGPGCTLAGRFTIRQGDPASAAARFLAPAPWARGRAWLTWNAKGLVKPVLGPAYARVADWLLSPRAVRSTTDSRVSS